MNELLNGRWLDEGREKAGKRSKERLNGIQLSFLNWMCKARGYGKNGTISLSVGSIPSHCQVDQWDYLSCQLRPSLWIVYAPLGRCINQCNQSSVTMPISADVSHYAYLCRCVQSINQVNQSLYASLCGLVPSRQMYQSMQSIILHCKPLSADGCSPRPSRSMYSVPLPVD